MLLMRSQNVENHVHEIRKDVKAVRHSFFADQSLLTRYACVVLCAFTDSPDTLSGVPAAACQDGPLQL